MIPLLLVALVSSALVSTVLGSTASAAQAPPLAQATLAPDGQYSLIMQPDTAWVAAEITVAGDHAFDLGPAEQDQRVQVDGWISGSGPLRVTVLAATPEQHGVTWSFMVDPKSVPVEPPVFESVPPNKRFLGIFRRRP